jgi:hypothetical protein
VLDAASETASVGRAKIAMPNSAKSAMSTEDRNLAIMLTGSRCSEWRQIR